MDNAAHAKRILFLCHDGKIYGSQKSLQLLVEHLPRDKYEIFVSFSRGGPLVEAFQAMADVTVLSHPRIQGVKHSQRPWFKRIGDVATTLLNAGRALSLARTIRAHRIDLVHTNSLVSFEGAIAAKLAGVPHVWHIRELFEDYNPRFQLILGKALTKALVHHFSHQVVCISHYVRGQFTPYVERSPSHYPVLYNAIPCPESLPETSPQASEQLNLVYTGRISDGKRFQDIIDAFCILKAQWQEALPFRLLVYGEFIDPAFERMVRTKMQEANLGEHFQLLGYRDNLDACLQGMDLLLMPSSTEAFGRTMLEAMVRGIPVLAARSGAPLEVIEEGRTGFLHAPNNPVDLAACLNAIYERRTDLRAMRLQCLTAVRQRFDVAHQIQQLDHLYQAILRREADGRVHPTPCWHGS